MAQSAGALCRIDPADNRLVGCVVIDPAGVEGGDLTSGTGLSGSGVQRHWLPRSTPRAGGSSGGSDLARAAAAPAPVPGSCGSQPTTFPSCTECPSARDPISSFASGAAANGASDMGGSMTLEGRDGHSLGHSPSRYWTLSNTATHSRPGREGTSRRSQQWATAGQHASGVASPGLSRSRLLPRGRPQRLGCFGSAAARQRPAGRWPSRTAH
jgi:hypothetical protein